MTFTASKPKMHETGRGVAWSTVISYNGVKVAVVENRGDGGCDWHEWTDRSKIDLFVAEVDKHNLSFTPDASVFPQKDHRGQPDADRSAGYVEHLMELAEFDAMLKRMCKKYVCLRMPGQPGKCFSHVKVQPTAANIAAVKAKYPEATILNPGA